MVKLEASQKLIVGPRKIIRKPFRPIAGLTYEIKPTK
jgi:hypothetical protein